MKLNPAPFEKIKSGCKTIELRLNDEKRRKISVGDQIIFTQTESGEKLNATVTSLHRFDSFEKLYSALPLSKCGYAEGEAACFKDMEKYYTPEQQAKYGVLGIELCVDKG